MPAKTTKVKWTPEQRLGIETTGRSLLVSAAAGSGKTAVLAARCAHLVCDATPACDVDRLLVVTFTKAAAAEMRQRIESALRDRLGDSANERLMKQLALVERAQISTIHSFCASVLRQHFNLLGIDPNFRTLEEEESALLRAEIARDMFAQKYEIDANGQFQRFIDGYADGNDERLLSRIIKTHEMLASLAQPGRWLETARRRLSEGAEKPLKQSELGCELKQLVAQHLESLRQQCISLATMIDRMGGLDAYVNHVGELLAAVESWSLAFADSNFDALAIEIEQFEKPKLPTIKNPAPQKELAHKQIDALKKQLKEGPLVQLLRFSEQQWRDGLRRIIEPANVFLDLVAEFTERYTTAKAALRAMDFSDLERQTLRVLRDPNAVELRPSPAARVYHERFDHVLVDEYQDINETQDAILYLVSRECLADCDPRPAPNLFCVGDVKQSIYRFRLAEPGRFMERYHRFRDDGVLGQLIPLQANFRSRGKLLDVLNGVFERLMTQSAAEIEYDDSHALRAGKEYPAANGKACFTGAPVELHLLPQEPDTGGEKIDDPAVDPEEFDRNEREAVLIARRIREMMGHAGKPRMNVLGKDDAGNEILRPLRWGDTVILLRSMKFKSDRYAQILRNSGIPVHSDSGTGFFNTLEIRDMLALLNVLDNQRQDIPLAAVLRSPLAGLPSGDDCLARIRLAVPKSVPFHLAVVRYAQQHDDELAAALRDLLHRLRRWREMAQRRPLAELIWTIYTETGYLTFCSGLPAGEQRTANLISLHERARQFGSFQRQGLARFMQFLQSLQEQADLGQPSVASEADDVVRIMSVHRSKGLEFPVVILPDLGREHNMQDCYGSLLVDREGYVGLAVVDETLRVRYPSLASMLLKQRLRAKVLAEELRVLYVAMTRAREHLILVGTCAENAPETWQARWSGHGGALPADVVLLSKCMLDWLGPVAAAMATANHRPIEITQHSAEDLTRWLAEAQRPPALAPPQERLAALEPLNPPPAMDGLAEQVAQRLKFAYEHRGYANLAAVQSVTGLTKHGRSAGGGAAPSRQELVSFDRALPLPRCFAPSGEPSPTDVGNWTHVALQHLDFTRSCTPADVKQQLADLVRRRLMAEDHVAAVDVETIAWVASTPLGEILRKHARVLMREVPLYVSAPPSRFDESLTSSDALDCVMIRGRIDLLVPTRDGLIVADYKTDNVTAETLDQRADFYRPQVQLYREAIERITGEKVINSHLIFLKPRIIVSG